MTSSKNVSILDHPAVSGRYLFPQARRIDDPLIICVDGARLACFHNVIDVNGFTLIHFHGNGEAVADYVPTMAEDFAQLGLNSLFVEYRDYGESTGEARLVAMLGDGEGVMKAVGIPPRKSIAFGRSIGSLYAIELAFRQPTIAGLILESGIADPYERFLSRADLAEAGFTENELMLETKRYFHHKKKMAGYTNPLLVLHAEDDGIVDVTHAERNYKWASSTQKRLVRFKQGDHNTIFGRNRKEYLAALASFIKTLRSRRI